MSSYEPPREPPARLLSDPLMIRACNRRDFAVVFRLVKQAGVYPSLIARRCEMTPSRVAEVISGRRVIKDMAVIERVADGLRIPGKMLGLADRAWEEQQRYGHDATTSLGSAPAGPVESHAAEIAALILDDTEASPDFVISLIESQIPALYQAANYFGPREPVPTLLLLSRAVARLLETSTGPTRDSALRTGALVAEFLGWLLEDAGENNASVFWSDRAMEWAQEAGDDHLQSYLLYRKSHQATSRSSVQTAIGLARAAQRVPDLTPQTHALAAQQEARGYALQHNPRAALAKLEEARILAALPVAERPEIKHDTSYCTPGYIEIQQATCWIDLGEPGKAIAPLRAALATLPEVYRNDRGVYLARLARAYVETNELDEAVATAIHALAVASQTGSARALGELDLVARTLCNARGTPDADALLERLRAVHDQIASQPLHLARGGRGSWTT